MPLAGCVSCISLCTTPISLFLFNCKYVYLLYLCFHAAINPFWVGVITNVLHTMECIGLWWLLISLNLINCSIQFVQLRVLGHCVGPENVLDTNLLIIVQETEMFPFRCCLQSFALLLVCDVIKKHKSSPLIDLLGQNIYIWIKRNLIVFYYKFSNIKGKTQDCTWALLDLFSCCFFFIKAAVIKSIVTLNYLFSTPASFSIIHSGSQANKTSSLSAGHNGNTNKNRLLIKDRNITEITLRVVCRRPLKTTFLMCQESNIVS